MKLKSTGQPAEICGSPKEVYRNKNLTDVYYPVLIPTAASWKSGSMTRKHVQYVRADHLAD